jgi:hypothetical protein
MPQLPPMFRPGRGLPALAILCAVLSPAGAWGQTAGPTPPAPAWERLLPPAMRHAVAPSTPASGARAPQPNFLGVGPASATEIAGEWFELPPVPRVSHSVIYDPVRDRMVILSGSAAYAPDFFGDAFYLSLGEDRWGTYATQGSATDGQSAIYDPVNDRIVLFGGYCGPPGPFDGPCYSSSLCLLPADGTTPPTWRHLWDVQPAGRAHHTAVYDPVRRRMLVMMGQSGVAPGAFNDVWALSLDGAPIWSPLQPSGTPPPAGGHYRAVYDAGSDRVILFSPSGPLWSLTLAPEPAWAPLAASGAGPPTAGSLEVVLDAARGRALVFRGAGDVWALTFSNPPAWSSIPGGAESPQGLADYSLMLDPVRGRLLVYGGAIADRGQVASLWELALTGGSGWHRSAVTDPPSRIGHALAYDSRRGRAVLLAGLEEESGQMADMTPWVFHPGCDARWTPLPVEGTPPSPRWFSTVVYDPARDRVLVLGGETSDNQYLEDLWELAFSPVPTWRQLAVEGSGPGARVAPATVYDAGRDRVILTGGFGPQGFFDMQPWELSLGTPMRWSPIMALGSPPAGRVLPACAYDAIRQRMLVQGGLDAATSDALTDFWSLSLAGPPTWTRLPDLSDATNSPSIALLHDATGDRVLALVSSYEGVLPYAYALDGSRPWQFVAACYPNGPGDCFFDCKGPPFVDYAQAIYDPASERAVLFGGRSLWPAQLWSGTWFLPLRAPVRQVEVAVRDCGDTPVIRPGVHGLLPATFFGAPATGAICSPFVAEQVNVATLTFAGAPVAHTGDGADMAQLEDVNGDGLTDLSVMFERASMKLQPADTLAVVEGRLLSGERFRSEVAVRILLEHAKLRPDPDTPALPPRLAVRAAATPASGTLRLVVELPSAAPARLDVLDVRGRRVRDVELNGRAAGRLELDLGREGLRAGVYLVRVRQGSASATAKSVLLD